MSRGPDKALTVEEFEARAAEYFDECKREGVKPIITELALSLGFSSRQSIYDYAKDPEYSHISQWVRLICESHVERGLMDGSVPPAAGIFVLKNYGWTDKQELDHTSSDNSMTPRDQGMAVLDALKRKHESE